MRCVLAGAVGSAGDWRKARCLVQGSLAMAGKPLAIRRWKEWLRYGLWRCEPCPTGVVVQGFDDSSRLWKPLAVAVAPEEALADVGRLVKLLNQKRADDGTRCAAFEAMKDIEKEGFTFATEMALDHVLARLEKAGK